MKKPATKRPSILDGASNRSTPPLAASVGSSSSIIPTRTSDQLRAELQETVCLDLLGPAGGPEEELDPREGRVRERYLVGILAPRGDTESFDESATLTETLAAAGPDSVEEGKTEGDPAAAAATVDTMCPSSIGLSVVVDDSAETLSVTCTWGYYAKAPSATVTNASGAPRRVWKREPRGGTVALRLDGEEIRRVVPDERQPEVILTGRVRKAENGCLVTIFLVNGQMAGEKPRDELYLFQPQLVLTSPLGGAIFNRRMRPTSAGLRQDPVARQELRTMAMLYRHRLEFATGHGVSVHAEPSVASPEQAVRVETRVMPWHDVPAVEPPRPEENPRLAGLILDMKELAELPSASVVRSLAVLPEAYAAWIAGEHARVVTGRDGLAAHQGVAADALASCDHAQRRIREGVDLLGRDPRAMEAFQFANRAMWQQRVHGIVARRVRKGEATVSDGAAAIDRPENRRWRPFQLAFILLNLPSLTDLHHPDRSHPTNAQVDLLWFPTGGGKTEAYLGLTAYTLALRRLQGDIGGRDGEHGLAVIMRYTLRLLTLQQFQRAATLLCACEMIRRADPRKWGAVPMRIGLWVGRKVTPNTTKQAAEALLRIKEAGRGGFGSPAQLTTCPWCGTAIQPGKHIKALEAPSNVGRTILYCGDDLGRCPFSAAQAPSEGLPVLVVDEEIYRNPPAVLLATVDKFAQMPWKGETQMLFGRVSGWCERHGFTSPEVEDAGHHPAAKNTGLPTARTHEHAPLRPPDLIIQDELHLISGPLGSMVGLYETAVDELCAWTVDGKRVRPKVVASTATIRRADQQVQRLFLRDVFVFPPHGTSLEDNFFSRQRPPSPGTPGRRYLGVCAFGKRYPAALIRVYVAFLSAAQQLYERHDLSADAWMTLVGYFNSIRELSGTRRLVLDDIRSRLQRADQRGLARRLLRYSGVEELTSRKSGTEIPAILDRLEIPFSAADDAAREAARKEPRGRAQEQRPYPYDVVLATNMISVGVDVDRLGLMVVAGQPKTTAEYIQATSRVGRQTPGLVCCLYNWARPRDLSHFETFEHYHATFYQHVEALSVTPFAARALDRGLSGVLAALVRLPEERLNGNLKANALTDLDPLLGAAMHTLVERSGKLTWSQADADLVRQMLDERRDHWLAQVRAAKAHWLGYRDATEEKRNVVGLLELPGKKDRWGLFTCLNSLRDVEPTVQLVLATDAGLDPLADELPTAVPATPLQP